MRLVHQIILASTNRHKFEEFRNLFALHAPQVELLSATNMIRNPSGLDHVEKYSTYLENAIAKARLINHAAHYPVLADDSGLEVMALDGKPGVRSRRFAPSSVGISQDQANRELLLKQLNQFNPGINREARFVCALALVVEGILIHTVGVLEGMIAEQPKGDQGFGYDSIFIPKGQSGVTRTLAEMTDSEKNKISHRALALEALVLQVRTRGITLAKP